MYEVWCDHKTRGSTPIQRALVGMSIVDILSSSAWFMSSWAVPEGSWEFAKGNGATCNYQGFLLQLAIGAPLFNASLGLYYALMIRMKWTDKMLAKIEYWVHGVIWTFSIGTSIALLPLKQYNQIGQVCWIIGSPVDCGDSTHIRNPDVPCERGNHAWLYGVFTFYGPLWICVGCCLVCMYLVYLEVRETFKRVRRYSFDVRASGNIGRTEVDSVAIQAILYSVSFFITWMPSTLWSVAHWFRFAAFWLDFLSAFCEPLQGMWNFLIFTRARRRTKNKIRRILSKVLPFVKFSELHSDVSKHSGNGRRSHHTHGSQLRTSNFGDSALYRSATLKAMEANASMAAHRESSVSALSFNNRESDYRESVISVVEDDSAAMTGGLPESAPAAKSNGGAKANQIILEEDEQSVISVLNHDKSSDSFRPEESGHRAVVIPDEPSSSPVEEGTKQQKDGGSTSGTTSIEAEDEPTDDDHPMYFL